MRTIVVMPYDPRWPEAFEKIRNEIWPSVQDIAHTIEHVGSTSVKGLYAKPIIDMNIVIERGSLPAIIERLAALGYQHEGERGIPDRDAFRYQNKPHLMPHHLYVCPADSVEHLRQVAFRDYLRTHPEAREMYSQIKLEMAAKHPHDIGAYIDGKEPVVMEIYRQCGIEPWK